MLLGFPARPNLYAAVRFEVPRCGIDPVTARPVGIVDGVDFQHSGQVRKVDVAGIKRTLDYGAMVLISSMAAVLGSPGEYVWYAASKGAVDSITIGLSKELAGDGIRVNAVSPGIILTDIHPPGRVERVAPTVPLQRAGTPDWPDRGR